MLAWRREMRTRRRKRRISDQPLAKSREKLWRRRIRKKLVRGRRTRSRKSRFRAVTTKTKK